MFELVRTNRFDRSLHQFVRRHPELRERLAKTLEDLTDDPRQPHLRLHALSGRLEGLSSVRISRVYRLIIEVDAAASEITLIDIGTHDDVYR